MSSGKMPNFLISASRMKGFAAFLHHVSVYAEYLWVLDIWLNKTRHLKTSPSGLQSYFFFFYNNEHLLVAALMLTDLLNRSVVIDLLQFIN